MSLAPKPKSTTYTIGAAEFTADTLGPGLYLVATPIGNLGDVTIRALATLAAADVILCEDTRTTARLLERYGIRTPMSAYHEHNAQKIRPGLLAKLKDGKAIALVSDAGMPLVSDPGYRLVKDCVEQEITVTAAPGPSAVLTALALSGLPTDRFLFLGFLPQKAGERQKLLSSMTGVAATLIAFESPHRLDKTLVDLAMIFGDRPIVVARELTKLHEELARGTAAELLASFTARDRIRGEICLVIAPAEADVAEDNETVIENAITQALVDFPASKAAAQVAKALNLPKPEIYARILKRRDAAADT
jgi:16S rRNA (cytidine1402-2'-O)-methyltransferase